MEIAIVIFGLLIGIILALIKLSKIMKEKFEQEAKDRDDYYWKRKHECIEKLIDFWVHREVW